jgi:hypothetical protein
MDEESKKKEQRPQAGDAMKNVTPQTASPP